MTGREEKIRDLHRAQQDHNIFNYSGNPTYFLGSLTLTDGNSNAFNANTKTNTEKFNEIKKSVKDINVEAFTGDERKRIEAKINRLQRCGASAQASVLVLELTTIDSMLRVREWDYKLLTSNAIKTFENNVKMTLTTDGLKLHICSLDTYVGNKAVGEAKDRIIPDFVLDKLEEANERELFDEYKVLYAENVKDPLLLGCIHGCSDYFLIAEWDDDISFDEIVSGKQKCEAVDMKNIY